MAERDHDVTTDLPRRRILQGLGGAGVVSLAGCVTGGEETGTGKGKDVYRKGSLNIGQAKSPVEFDPIVLNDVPSTLVADRVFEGLLAYDKPGDTRIEHVPLLADGMPEVSKNDTRYTVSIKDDATFQNGDPVTAEDVKYTLEAPVEEGTENASEVNMIDTISVVDDRTVRIDLKYPYGPFLHSLHFGVVPKSVREKDKKAFNKKDPVGSGPFEFVGWKEGQYAKLERWDDYWGGQQQPNLKKVNFKPVTEPTTRLTTLQNNENRVIQNIPPNLWKKIEGMKNASIESKPGISYFYLAFNCKEGPTKNLKVRKAVDYCFSMDEAVEKFVEPAGVRQYSPLPEPVAKTWNMPLDEWKKIPHGRNLDEAKRLFDEAGVPKDYSWRIIVPPDKKREQIGITVGNGLKAAGFSNVSVKRYEWGTFLDLYVTGNEEDYNMFTLGWSGVPDPDSFTYYLLARTEDVLGETNGTFWGAHSEKGRRAARKFTRARKSGDHEKRRRLYREGITTALEQRAHIPSYNLKNSWGVKDAVHDFEAHSVDVLQLVSRYNNTWAEKK